VQLAGKALVLRFGPEAGDAPALVVGVEVQVQADGVLDAADETHAGVGLFFHGVFSLCLRHYSIDAGIGQTSAFTGSFNRGPAAMGRVPHLTEEDGGYMILSPQDLHGSHITQYSLGSDSRDSTYLNVGGALYWACSL
jgi:hypothetical protein